MLREANLGRCSLVWSLAHNESRMHQQLGDTERHSGIPNPAAQIHTLLLRQPWISPGAAEEVKILLAIGHPPPHYFWAGDTPGGTFDGLLPSPEPADEVVGSAEPQCFRNSHRSRNQMAGCPAIVCMQVLLRLKFGSICSSFRCSDLEGPSMHPALAVQLAVCFGAEIPAKVSSIRSNFMEANCVHTSRLFLPTRIPCELRD